MVSENGTKETVRTDGAGLTMFVGGLVLGSIVGGAVALLFAPMKGSDTRRMLKEKAVEAERMVEAKSGELKERAGEMVEDVKVKSGELKDRAGEVVAEVRGKAVEARKRGEDVLDCIKQA